jgi:hypothetical protein
MSRQKIIRRIVDRELKGLNLAEDIIMQDEPELYNSSCELFGTWDTALRYAGIKVRRLSKDRDYDTPEGVIKHIRKLCFRGYKLTSGNAKRYHHPFFLAARRYFGSWGKALKAAGINIQRADLNIDKPRRLKKENIIESIREWKDAGNSLRWREVCLHNRSLAIAARSAFHSWRRALVAAELIQDVPHAKMRRKWNRQHIIDIISLRRQEGKSLCYKDMRKDDLAVALAAIRYFGSWALALKAAGISVDSCNGLHADKSTSSGNDSAESI